MYYSSNAFKDSKNSHSTITSQHSEDEDDYVLDIDVDMGVESTYDDDGYRDESDDQSSEPSSEMKSKIRDVIELDSSPEKSPRKHISRDLPQKLSSQECELKATNQGEKEVSHDVKIDSLKKPKAEDPNVIEKAVDNTIVPTQNVDVPNDNKNNVLEKPISPADIPIEQYTAGLPSIDLNKPLESANKVQKDDFETINDDTKPTEKMDFTNDIIVQNSPKIDLKESTEKDHEPKSSRINKRRRSSSCSLQEDDISLNIHNTNEPKNQEGEEEEVLPAKKLKAELDTIFPKHNQVLTDYINKTSNETVDNIQSHINELLVEIHTLNDMIKTNENEWNNMIYLKKMKEEIFLRLTRKKQTIQLESKKIGDISALFNDFTTDETLIPKHDEIDKQRGPQLSSTPLQNKNSSVSNQHLAEQVSTILDGFESNSKSFSQSAANMIIQNRANMKSSELAKEKLNMQKVHR